MTKRHTAISRQVMSIGLTVILCVGLTPAMCGIDADNTAQVDALMGQVRSGEKPGGIGIGFAGQIIQLGPSVVPSVSRYADDPNEKVRETAATVLCRFRDPDSIPVFFHLLDDSDANVGASAIGALSQDAKTSLSLVKEGYAIGGGRPAVIRFMKRNNMDGYLATFLIGDLEDKSAIPDIREVLETPIPNVPEDVVAQRLSTAAIDKIYTDRNWGGPSGIFPIGAKKQP